MKLWLDDERPAPEGWTLFTEAPLALASIRSGRGEIASLDHDLGPTDITGYWLLCQVENDVARGVGYKLPEFRIHSANPVGRKNMASVLTSISRLDKSPTSGPAQ